MKKNLGTDNKKQLEYLDEKDYFVEESFNNNTFSSKGLKESYSDNGGLGDNYSPLKIERKVEEKKNTINAQDWLEKNYPKRDRSNVIILDASKKKLKGFLDLGDFVNLKSLNCSDNKLDNINVNKCYKLENLDCNNNYLTSTDFLTSLPNPQKITSLYLNNNNFLTQDLNFLKGFKELHHLYIGTEDKERIKQGVYNRFTGSLEILKDNPKLSLINMSNTDIDSV